MNETRSRNDVVKVRPILGFNFSFLAGCCLGQQAGIFTETTCAIIIAMSPLTSIVAPPALGALLTKEVRQTSVPGIEP
jgi:hypothetical protein